MASSTAIWETILRTKTAVGQVLLGRDAVCQLKVKLIVIENGRSTSSDVEPRFMLPTEIKRSPAFRFLDLNEYNQTHAEQTAPPPSNYVKTEFF